MGSAVRPGLRSDVYYDFLCSRLFPFYNGGAARPCDKISPEGTGQAYTLLVRDPRISHHSTILHFIQPGPLAVRMAIFNHPGHDHLVRTFVYDSLHS